MTHYVRLIAGLVAALAWPAAGWAAEATLPPAQVETTAERGHVAGEVLRIQEGQFFTLRDPAGKEVSISISTDLNPGLKAGDRIEATINDKGEVLTLDKLDRTPPQEPNAGR
jgi:hypothetical protein